MRGPIFFMYIIKYKIFFQTSISYEKSKQVIWKIGRQ